MQVSFFEQVDNLIESFQSEELEETISMAQRRKRAITAKKNRAKMKQGRRKAERRLAKKDRLKRRANRSTRRIVAKKVSGGKSKSSMSASQKASAERRVNKQSGLLKRVGRKQFYAARKRDRNK